MSWSWRRAAGTDLSARPARATVSCGVPSALTDSVTATSPRSALTGPSARSAACRASTAQVNRSGSG